MRKYSADISADSLGTPSSTRSDTAFSLTESTAPLLVGHTSLLHTRAEPAAEVAHKSSHAYIENVVVVTEAPVENRVDATTRPTITRYCQLILFLLPVASLQITSIKIIVGMIVTAPSRR